MKKANKIDKPYIIDILCESFEKNKSVNYVIKQDRKRKQRLLHLMNYSYDLCSMFGEIYLSEDRKACALILFPDKKKTTLKTVLLDVRLILSSIGLTRVFKVLKRDSKIKSFYPKESVYYLWFIGVKPEDQLKGIGGKLLSELINESNFMKRPIYLETSMIENLSFYKKHGFKIYQQLDFGHALFSMKRENYQN
jgi:hypothetical protein